MKTHSCSREGCPWRRASRIVLTVLIAATLASLYTLARTDAEDLLVYRTAAANLAGGRDMYEPTPGLAQFTYPPLMALPLVPLLVFPHWAQTWIWQTGNILLLLGSLLILYRCVAPMAPQWRNLGIAKLWPAYLLFALLAGRHLLSPLENRSHDLIVLLVLMLAILGYCRGRELAAGALAGIAAALKATPLLFLPMLVWQRRFVAAAAMLIAIVLATLSVDLLYPREDGRLWGTAWFQRFVAPLDAGAPAEGEGWMPWNQLNQNLAGTIYRLSRHPDPQFAKAPHKPLWNPSDSLMRSVTLAAQLILLGIVAAATWPGRTRRLDDGERHVQRLGEAGVILCAMLLLSPMSSKSHFCVLAVPIAFCLADFLVRRRSVVTGALLLIVLILGTLTVKDLIGRRLGNMALAYGNVMWCTLALLAATLHVMRDRLRESPVPESSPQSFSAIVPAAEAELVHQRLR